jgi:hypothetical protein
MGGAIPPLLHIAVFNYAVGELYLSFMVHVTSDGGMNSE